MLHIIINKDIRKPTKILKVINVNFIVKFSMILFFYFNVFINCQPTYDPGRTITRDEIRTIKKADGDRNKIF